MSSEAREDRRVMIHEQEVTGLLMKGSLVVKWWLRPKQAIVEEGQVRGRSLAGPKALDTGKIWVHSAHHSLHPESPSPFPL